jgi:hypothetical protein
VPVASGAAKNAARQPKNTLSPPAQIKEFEAHVRRAGILLLDIVKIK